MAFRYVDLVGVLVQHPDLSAQHAEDLEAHRHIADVRQILDDADVCCQDRSGQDAHSRILRAGDDDFAVQGLTARNNKLFQFYDLLVTSPLPAGPKGELLKVLIPSRCTKLTTNRYTYSYLIIHNFQQKAKPQCTLIDYFLFCPVSFRISSDFVSF